MARLQQELTSAVTITTVGSCTDSNVLMKKREEKGSQEEEKEEDVINCSTPLLSINNSFILRPNHSPTQRSPVVSPQRSLLVSPQKSPLTSQRSPLTSPQRSPLTSPKPPLTSPQRSPITSPEMSPLTSPQRLPVISSQRSSLTSQRSPVSLPQKLPITPQRSPQKSMVISHEESPKCISPFQRSGLLLQPQSPDSPQRSSQDGSPHSSPQRSPLSLHKTVDSSSQRSSISPERSSPPIGVIFNEQPISFIEHETTLSNEKKQEHEGEEIQQSNSPIGVEQIRFEEINEKEQQINSPLLQREEEVKLTHHMRENNNVRVQENGSLVEGEREEKGGGGGGDVIMKEQDDHIPSLDVSSNSLEQVTYTSLSDDTSSIVSCTRQEEEERHNPLNITQSEDLEEENEVQQILHQLLNKPLTLSPAVHHSSETSSNSSLSNNDDTVIENDNYHCSNSDDSSIHSNDGSGGIMKENSDPLCEEGYHSNSAKPPLPHTIKRRYICMYLYIVELLVSSILYIL